MKTKALCHSIAAKNVSRSGPHLTAALRAGRWHLPFVGIRCEMHFKGGCESQRLKV